MFAGLSRAWNKLWPFSGTSGIVKSNDDDLATEISALTQKMTKSLSGSIVTMQMSAINCSQKMKLSRNSSMMEISTKMMITMEATVNR